MQITDLQTVHKELDNLYIPQYIVVVNTEILIYCFSKSLKIANTHYLRVKCVLQAHHENNAYCVRIKGVLFLRRMTKVHPRVHGKRSGLPLCKLLD